MSDIRSYADNESLGLQIRDMPSAAERFRRKNWLMLPGLLESHAVIRLLAAIKECPSTRVCEPTAPQGETWLEFQTASQPRIRELFFNPEILNFVYGALSVSTETKITNFQSWANMYTAGERIAAHRDVAGDVQLLIQLETPPRQYGGHLLLGEECEEILLQPGDALLFEAKKILHQTTPIVPRTHSEEQYSRINLVGRYFF